jgi:hypothetical protein
MRIIVDSTPLHISFEMVMMVNFMTGDVYCNEVWKCDTKKNGRECKVQMFPADFGFDVSDWIYIDYKKVRDTLQNCNKKGIKNA